jgi:nucleotide-binding universal stress UspA family protein
VRHAPIVAVVEAHSVRVMSEMAARLARALGASLAFVYVRPCRPATPGDTYQRSLSRDLVRGLKVIQAALAVATSHGVMAHGEIVEESRSHASRGDREFEPTRLRA